MDLTKISQADEKASRPTHMHASHQNRGTLELGTLAEQARRVAQRRREWGEKIELFETRRRDAELRLDKMLKIMDDSMKHLSGVHKDFEEVRKQFAKQEAEVTSKVKDIRAEADRTRATADQVTAECRRYHESKERAERELANANMELKGLVQELGIF